jgi:hypothetical protein
VGAAGLITKNRILRSSGQLPAAPAARAGDPQLRFLYWRKIGMIVLQAFKLSSRSI